MLERKRGLIIHKAKLEATNITFAATWNEKFFSLVGEIIFFLNLAIDPNPRQF